MVRRSGRNNSRGSDKIGAPASPYIRRNLAHYNPLDDEQLENSTIKMLENYQTPPMDSSVKEELKAYVDKRKSELPDAWY